jgi:hypothetical protein
MRPATGTGTAQAKNTAKIEDTAQDRVDTAQDTAQAKCENRDGQADGGNKDRPADDRHD